MPSKPASLASWRHSFRLIRSGYGKAQRLIDFFIRYRFGDARRGSGWAWRRPASPRRRGQQHRAPAAASVDRIADRRMIGP